MLPKIVWAEGILLGQQHFQLWEDFWQQQQWLMLQSVQPDLWGLSQLEIDTHALNNGIFRLHTCAGIFPDGLWFQYNRLQKTLSKELQLQPGEITDIYVGIADNQSVSAISGYREHKNLSRWQARYSQVTDHYDLERQREVLLGELNLQLIIGDDFKESCQKIKVAQIKRESSGQYQWVSRFIPTVISANAATGLEELLLRWQEQIKSKIVYLQERQLFTNFTPTPAAMQALIILPWLQMIWQRLHQFTHRRNVHPKEIYGSGMELWSVLSSLMKNAGEKNDLIYLHDDLTSSFNLLEQQLSIALETINFGQMAKLQLQRQNENLYVIKGIELEILHKQQFFIAAYHASESVDWITQFIRQIKIAAVSQIDTLMTSALSGVRLVHVQRPPQQIDAKAGHEYFYLDINNESWQQIIFERSLAVFLPDDLINAEIEIVTTWK